MLPPFLAAIAQRERRPRSRRGSLLELVVIVAVALGLALLIQALIVKPFRIPSESMVPTLAVGERVLVDRLSYRFGEPDRGQIVVFHPPEGAESNTCGAAAAERGQDAPCPEPTDERSDQNFIKRVVGVPGDELSVVDGIVHIDGEPLEEPYIRASAQCGDCDLPDPITIPPDHLFMMGDNRGQSADSRVWGPVPEEWLIGKAFFTYWPPSRIGPL